MSDMTITGAAKFGSVITEMQKVEKASDSMKRKVERLGGSRGRQGTQGKTGYERPGMGLLEVSRGVEDFAVAGMRGLLNNIPGMIMSFGGSMGLAAVVSLAAVAVTVLGKGLYDLATDAEANKKHTAAMKDANDKWASSIESAKNKVKSYRAEQRNLNEESKQTAKMQETMRRFGDPMGAASNRSSAKESQRAAASSINALKTELFQIGGGGNPGKIDLVGNATEDTEEAKRLIADLIRQRTDVERELSKSMTAGMGDFAAKLHDIETAIALAEHNSARHKANMEKAAEVGSKYGEEANRLLMERDKRTIETLEEEKRLLEQSNKFHKQELDIYNKKISAIDQDIAAAMRSEQSAKERLQYTKEEVALREKIEERTRINTERQRFGEALLKNLEKQAALMERFATIEANLSGMGLNGSSMLSSSGRIGGSGAEYASAIATINYQRETLSVLREIARNSARKNQTTYN